MADPSTYRPKPGTIPTDPGVYRFSDAHGQVIYVGKAKKLKNRVSQYFTHSKAHTVKVRAMVARIDDFDIVLAEPGAKPTATAE